MHLSLSKWMFNGSLHVNRSYGWSTSSEVYDVKGLLKFDIRVGLVKHAEKVQALECSSFLNADSFAALLANKQKDDQRPN